MSGSALAVFNAWLCLSSIDADKYKGTIMIYAGVVRQLFSCYAGDDVVAKAYDEIKLKQLLLALWERFQKLWSVKYDDVYKEHTLRIVSL